jgi:hypothetical protein
MITSAWITTTRSMGMPVAACIGVAPARSTPNRSAAKTTPSGVDPPRRAMAIPSKPYPGEKPGVRDLVTPRISVAPARPASPPQTAIVRIRVFEMLMPA